MEAGYDLDGGWQVGGGFVCHPKNGAPAASGGNSKLCLHNVI